MKLLTALAPAVLIVGLMGCNSYGFSSRYEAETACDKEAEWIKENSDFSKGTTVMCKEEEETNQLLLVNAKKNKGILTGWETGKVIKRFRY